MADFLVALADFDDRRCWEELGYSGLFDYLHRDLGVSRGTAFYRKTAADLVRRFPEVVEPLKDGRLCITSVVELAKVITPENRGEVLPRFFHRSKREAMAVAAELCPKEAIPLRAVVTEVEPRSGTLALSSAARPPVTAGSRSAAVQPVELPAPPVVPPPPAHPRPETIPLTADLRRLHVTVSTGFLAKVEAARSALSHSRPGASLEDVLEAGLDLHPGTRGQEAGAAPGLRGGAHGSVPPEPEPRLGEGGHRRERGPRRLDATSRSRRRGAPPPSRRPSSRRRPRCGARAPRPRGRRPGRGRRCARRGRRRS